MNQLRRDLIERRLWPVVVVLLLAIVAVPLLLSSHASGSPGIAVPPVPAVASALIADASTPKSSTEPASRRLLIADVMRDPFAAGVSKLTSKAPAHMSQDPSAETTSSASPVATSTVASAPQGSSVTATPTAASSGATAAVPSSLASLGVAPTPAQTSTTPATSTTAAASGTPTASKPADTSTNAQATRTVTVTNTVTTTTPAKTPPGPTSWTLYGANVKVSSDGGAAVTHVNIEKLTPLPSVAMPEVMFDGVAKGGKQAIFALQTGVQATGPAFCRPDHALCRAIVLAKGGSEQLAFTDAAGQPATLTLSLTHISTTVVHSQALALAASQRESAAGACELDLSDPVVWSMTPGGTFITSASVPSLCLLPGTLVPFQSVQTAPAS